jgi:hypothetical protein
VSSLATRLTAFKSTSLLSGAANDASPMAWCCIHLPRVNCLPFLDTQKSAPHPPPPNGPLSTVVPTNVPSRTPTSPTMAPSRGPTTAPTTLRPTIVPTNQPSTFIFSAAGDGPPERE